MYISAYVHIYKCMYVYIHTYLTLTIHTYTITYMSLLSILPLAVSKTFSKIHLIDDFTCKQDLRVGDQNPDVHRISPRPRRDRDIDIHVRDNTRPSQIFCDQSVLKVGVKAS